MVQDTIIHEIKFNIEIKNINIKPEEYMKIITNIQNKIIKKNGKMDFKELDKILDISERKYYFTSMKLPNIEYNDNFSIKETKVEIQAG